MVRDSFDIDIVNSNGRAVVHVHGEVDLRSGSAFGEALAGAQQDSADVIVDLSDLTFMDSTGINALLEAYHRVPQGGSVRVVGATSAIRRLFDITGISELLLLEPQRLIWRQVTYHTSGWRQWMTEKVTTDGTPIAEIVEVGPNGSEGSCNVRYALESNGETTFHRSLDQAMRAAELLSSVGPPEEVALTSPPDPP